MPDKNIFMKTLYWNFFGAEGIILNIAKYVRTKIVKFIL